MQLQRLTADGLRNLSEIAIDAHPRLTIFVGDNGVGKTNLLEAVHLVAALRPLKPLERSRDLLGFGRDRAVVLGEFDLDGPLPIEVVVEPKGRKATLAGKSVRDIGQVAARIGVVSFTPEDLVVIRQGPDHRRRALDRFAYGLEPAFAAAARRYDQALSRRNRVLKEAGPHVVEAYTPPLVDAAVSLYRARLAAVAQWAPPFAEAAAQISDGKLEAKMRYVSAVLDDAAALCGQDVGPELPDDALARALTDRLAKVAEGERTRRTTLAGPHLDDVAMTLRREDQHRRARHLASQGEARALVLAMKIAQVRVYTQARQTAPLLLLDDVAGELDPHRAECLFGVADEVGAQTFVTVTHIGALPAFGEACVYAIDGGRAQATQPPEAPTASTPTADTIAK